VCSLRGFSLWGLFGGGLPCGVSCSVGSHLAEVCVGWWGPYRVPLRSIHRVGGGFIVDWYCFQGLGWCMSHDLEEDIINEQ
jgi:hypothetical protein